MNKDQAKYYQSKEEISIGDIVKYGENKGEIVFVISSKQFSQKYPENEWGYLKEGIGIETEKYGLIQEIEPDSDLVLLKRRSG